MENMKTLTTLVLVASALTFRAVAAEPTIKLKTKPYPMDVCVISDEKLGSMGDPVVFTEGDQEIQLCCKGCQKDFTKNKEENLKKIEAAWKKVKRYPLTACIASDEPLDPQEAVGLVH